MDILTIGEVLIDLTQTGKDARGIPQFAANPGGASSSSQAQSLPASRNSSTKLASNHSQAEVRRCHRASSRHHSNRLNRASAAHMPAFAPATLAAWHSKG